MQPSIMTCAAPRCRRAPQRRTRAWANSDYVEINKLVITRSSIAYLAKEILLWWGDAGWIFEVISFHDNSFMSRGLSTFYNKCLAFWLVARTRGWTIGICSGVNCAFKFNNKPNGYGNKTGPLPCYQHLYKVIVVSRGCSIAV